jgi:RNA polymerase sigma-70 factor (ECF subfamily)
LDLKQKQKEFERVAVPHMDLLFSYAMRITNNEEDAQDLLQETYLKAFRFWEQFEKGTNLKAWLFRIMKNSYINRYRKEKKEGESVSYNEIEEFYDSLKDESAVESSDLQHNLYTNLLDDEVTNALDSLPDDFRTVILLCDIEGLQYEEIAEFLQCPIGTVRSRLHRGRKMLQKKLLTYAKKKGYITNV